MKIIEIKLKKCSKCEEEKPATSEYFHSHKGCKDDLNNACKACRKIISASRNRKQHNLPNGYKNCVDCNEILEINEQNFNITKKSSDGFYNVCIKCQIKRRRNGADEGFKTCKTCRRTFLLDRNYYRKENSCIDGFNQSCLECLGQEFFPKTSEDPWTDKDKKIVKDNYNDKIIKEIIPLLSTKRTEKAILHIAGKLGLRKIKSYVEDYDKYKYKIIDNALSKLCKKCKRYLPLDYDYFIKDKSCADNYRNICRECMNYNFRNQSNYHIWNEEEKKILKEKYPHMTNNELKETYFPYISFTENIMSKAYSMGIYKTEETIQRALNEFGRKNSKRLIQINKWVAKDNPQYNSQRFGELNPNYKGGISSLYQELRRNIKQWKLDSMENCNYKCILTGEKFDDIHHLYSFDSIVQDTLKETGLELFDKIEKYTNDELKQLIDKCLEIHYRHPLGVCLREDIHLQFHIEQKFGGNTEYQFYEFIENFYKGKYKNLIAS